MKGPNFPYLEKGYQKTHIPKQLGTTALGADL